MSDLSFIDRRALIGSILILLVSCAKEENKAPPVPPPPIEPIADYNRAIGPEPAPFAQYHVGEIRSGDSLSTAMARQKVNAREVDEIVNAMLGTYDFRYAQPGHLFEIKRDEAGKLIWFQYSADPTTTVMAYRGSDGLLHALREPVYIKTSTVTVQGEVNHSLYLAMDAAGEKPWLTLTMVDIFAWDVDFFTETQKGDSFRIVVEKRYLDGAFISYGRVLGAEYNMGPERRHRAFRFEFDDGKVGYYREDGKAVEKAFLKSPIKFASITSRYGLRRHPILKYMRAHRGVDYGAPRGTAVWAVGDGVVTHAGRRGGLGIAVFLRHKNGLATRYGHLNGLGKGIRRGKRVHQKQTIGYVGSTGMSTGPHLHFEVLRGGRHMNPLTLVAPPAPPIPELLLAQFQETVAPYVALIDGTALEEASSTRE